MHTALIADLAVALLPVLALRSATLLVDALLARPPFPAPLLWIGVDSLAHALAALLIGSAQHLGPAMALLWWRAGPAVAHASQPQFATTGLLRMLHSRPTVWEPGS